MLSRSLQFVESRRILSYAFLFLFLAFNATAASTSLIHVDGAFQNPNFNRLYEEALREKSNGNFQHAISLLTDCLRPSNGERRVDCLINLAILYWNTGNIKESHKFNSEAVELSNKLGLTAGERFATPAIKIINLYQEGKADRLNGEYEKSIQRFEEAISTARSIKSPEYELKCLRLMSATYWELNDFGQFYSLNSKALELAHTLKHSKEIGRCLNNIGAYYGKYDNYSAALSSYEKALTIAKNEGDTEDIAVALLNIGGIWSDIGDYDKSLVYLKQAFEIDKRAPDQSSLAKDLNNIGIAFRLKSLASENKKDFREAEANFQKALAIARSIDDRALLTEVMNNLGSVYADQAQFSNALDYFKSAATISEEDNDLSLSAMVYNNIGIAYSNLGAYEDANRYYEKALSLAALYKSGTFIWETFYELGNAHKKKNDLPGALENYKNAIDSIEGVRAKITLEDLKASYLGTDKRIEVYQNLIDLLVTLHAKDPGKGYDREAFNYLERGKARAFLDSLEVADVDISQGINPVLANREKEAMRGLSKGYNKLLSAEASPEDKKIVSEQIKSLEDQIESLRREIRISSPAYADLKYPEVITYDQVRKELLTSKAAFFAYSLGKEASYAFAVSRKGLRIFKLPPRSVLQQQVIAYRKAISDRQNKDFRLGLELYQELVSPGLAPGIEKIVIIPDDILNLLPFETLLTSREPRSWLVREYEIGYVPSLSSLRVLTQRHKNGSRPRKDLLALGDASYGMSSDGKVNIPDLDILYGSGSSTGITLSPLKYSAMEIQSISRLFPPGKVTLLEKQEATERWLKSNPLADYKIIHFATHSLIDDKKPARSAILLSFTKDQAGEGLLQTRDIYNFKLNADLVTLSACQTGLGQFIRGEGIEGLSRAFFYAGSSSVLMSLWAVNDQATSLLMERFYRHLRGSTSLTGALRDAKLEMIQSQALSHPFYWAGFVVNGKTDSKVFPGRNLGFLLAASLGICMVVVVAVVSHRRKKV